MQQLPESVQQQLIKPQIAASSTQGDTVINQIYLDANSNILGQAFQLPWSLAKILAASMRQVDGDLLLQSNDESLIITNWEQNEHINILATLDGHEVTMQSLIPFISTPGRLSAGPGGAQQIAYISKLSGEVWMIDSQGNRIQLSGDDMIVAGSVIETAASGRLSLRFLDASELDIAPSSRVAVNDFNYDQVSQNGFSFLSVLKGIFAFSSGLIAQDNPINIKFDTPITEIGIRGTSFIVKITEAGEIELALLQGRVTLDAFGRITELVRPFDGIRLDANELELVKYSPALLIRAFSELYDTNSQWQELLQKAQGQPQIAVNQQQQVPLVADNENNILGKQANLQQDSVNPALQQISKFRTNNQLLTNEDFMLKFSVSPVASAQLNLVSFMDNPDQIANDFYLSESNDDVTDRIGQNDQQYFMNSKLVATVPDQLVFYTDGSQSNPDLVMVLIEFQITNIYNQAEKINHVLDFEILNSEFAGGIKYEDLLTKIGIDNITNKLKSYYPDTELDIDLGTSSSSGKDYVYKLLSASTTPVAVNLSGKDYLLFLTDFSNDIAINLNVLKNDGKATIDGQGHYLSNLKFIYRANGQQPEKLALAEVISLQNVKLSDTSAADHHLSIGVSESDFILDLNGLIDNSGIDYAAMLLLGDGSGSASFSLEMFLNVLGNTSSTAQALFTDIYVLYDKISNPVTYNLNPNKLTLDNAVVALADGDGYVNLELTPNAAPGSWSVNVHFVTEYV